MLHGWFQVHLRYWSGHFIKHTIDGVWMSNSESCHLFRITRRKSIEANSTVFLLKARIITRLFFQRFTVNFTTCDREFICVVQWVLSYGSHFIGDPTHDLDSVQTSCNAIVSSSSHLRFGNTPNCPCKKRRVNFHSKLCSVNQTRFHLEYSLDQTALNHLVLWAVPNKYRRLQPTCQPTKIRL